MDAPEIAFRPPSRRERSPGEEALLYAHDSMRFGPRARARDEKTWLHYRPPPAPLYGYARVSTRDQDLAAEDADLMAAGCAKVFREKISGAKTDRPELAKLIGRLESGDVLVAPGLIG